MLDAWRRRIRRSTTLRDASSPPSPLSHSPPSLATQRSDRRDGQSGGRVPASRSRLAPLYWTLLSRAGERAAVAGPQALVDASIKAASTASPELSTRASARQVKPSQRQQATVLPRAFPRRHTSVAVAVGHHRARARPTILGALLGGPIDLPSPPHPGARRRFGVACLRRSTTRTSFSISFAPILASGLLGGPVATLLATWSVAILRGILRDTRWDKVLFNGATFSLFGVAARHW